MPGTTAVLGATHFMDNLYFKTMTDPADAPAVISMMESLYREDPTSGVDPARFPVSIEKLLSEPHRGRIIVFLEQSEIRGYAILIPYLSNEFGGVIVFIDELFVVAGSRSRGIGGSFFEFLFREHPFDAVAAALEVSPANIRARRLYESIGFQPRSHSVFTRRIPQQ